MKKTKITFETFGSLYAMVDFINDHNEQYPEHEILKEDIVEIRKEEDTYILLYYTL